MRLAVKIALGSILVGGAVFGAKLAAAHVSHSTALFSDALEAMVNVASSLLALYALILGAKPADQVHNYGHAKAELISAVATGAMILIAAMLIFQRAMATVVHPPALEPLTGGLGVGLALNGVAGAINGLWAMMLMRVGRAHKSPALVADGKHLLSDLITTIGILAALLLASFLHMPVLDPVVALLIAVQIAWIGGHTVMDSLSGLMDRAPPPDMQERIQAAVREHATGAIEAHDLRIREVGAAGFLEFHLVVPGEMSVNDSHAICDRIEAALKQEMPGVVITIHVEPPEKAKTDGAIVP